MAHFVDALRVDVWLGKFVRYCARGNHLKNAYGPRKNKTRIANRA